MVRSLLLAALILTLVACAGRATPVPTPVPTEAALAVPATPRAASIPDTVEPAASTLPTEAAVTTGGAAPTETTMPAGTAAPTPTVTATTTSTPPPTGTAAPTATVIATTTSTPSPTTLVPPSLTSGPTVTTSSPSPVATTTRRPQPTRAAPSPTSTVIPAPTLLEPVTEATIIGRGRFAWEWNGPRLPGDLFFDLRIWSDREEKAGAVPRGAVKLTKGTVADLLMPFVPAVRDYGEGQYYWSVVVVRAGDPPEVVGQWAPKRWFIYRDPTPTPIPTDEPEATSAP
jgi:hypothetical protein